jgi:hypothetical protein
MADLTRPHHADPPLLHAWGWLLATALFLWGMWSFPIAMLGPERNLVPGDMGDARFNNYVLEHFHAYATGRVDNYWDAPMMYPQKNVIARSDNLLGTAPVYSTFRTLGWSRESAFQLWILVLFALNFWCAFGVSLSWVRIPWLAGCGAFFFAFGIHGVARVDHAATLPAFLVPVVLFMMWQWLRTARHRYIILAALAIVGQFYCSVSLGFALLLGMAVLVLVQMLVQGRGATCTWAAIRPRVRMIGAATVLTLALLAPLWAGPAGSTSGMAATLPPADGSSTWASLFRAHPAALSWQDLAVSEQVDPSEARAPSRFMGAVPWLALLLVPLLLRRKVLPATHRLTMHTLGLTWALLVIPPMIPGLMSVRSIAALSAVQAVLMMFLMVAVVAALADMGRRWRGTLMVLTPLLLVVDDRVDPGRIHTFDKHHARQVVSQVRTRMQAHFPVEHTALAYAPVLPVTPQHALPRLRAEVHLTAMLAAQEMDMPIVNAYVRNGSRSFLDTMDPTDLHAWCRTSGCDAAHIRWTDNVGYPVDHVERISLMAHDGRYVCADRTRHDVLVADREEAGHWESFVLVHLVDGRTGIMTHAGQWAWAELFKDGAIRGDSPELGDLGLFQVERDAAGRMAFRCGDGRFLTAAGDGSLIVRSDDQAPGIWFMPAPLPEGYQ